MRIKLNKNNLNYTYGPPHTIEFCVRHRLKIKLGIKSNKSIIQPIENERTILAKIKNKYIHFPYELSVLIISKYLNKCKI